MTSYYPTLAVIGAAGFSSFRQLYRAISQQGCQSDEFYTITYIDNTGLIHSLAVPVWRILSNSIKEITKRHRPKRNPPEI